MTFRKAVPDEISKIAAIYDEIHTQEEAGQITVGWIRGIYPTEATAQAALGRNDLFVLEEDGRILGAAIINKIQVDVYEGAPWEHEAKDEEITVLHTLVISPREGRRGLGSSFVSFYEKYARETGAPYLRMDTNAGNLAARALYKKLGYKEIGIVPCVFNGIEGVNLVLLEKKV